MRSVVIPRPVAAGVVLVAAVAAVLGVLLVTVVDLRDASTLADRSDEVLTSAATVERLVLDLETGVRGYVITGQPAFLEPWRRGRTSIPSDIARLERLVAGNRSQELRARAIAAGINSYMTDFALPLVQQVGRDMGSARREFAMRSGKSRVDRIRAQFAGFNAAEARLAVGRRDSAASSARIAVGAGVVGVVVLIALVSLLTTYITRAFNRERRAAGRIARLQELTTALSTALGMEDVARIVTEQGLTAFGALGAAVAIREGDTLKASAFVAREPADETRGSEADARRCFDVAVARGLDGPEPTRIPGCTEPNGWVSLPLVGSRRLLGMLALRFQTQTVFAAEVRSQMIAISAQCGQTIERVGLEAAQEAALDGARQARDRIALVASAGEVLAESLDYEATLRKVADLAVLTMADWCSVHLASDGEPLRNVAVAHTDPGKIALARALQERYPPDPDALSGPPNVVRTGRSELYPAIPDEMLAAAARDQGELDAIRALGLVSAMTVPLNARGRTLGAITFVAAESGRHYDENDLSLAESLADRAALAIDNARLYRQERGIAETLQRSLLPEALPQMPRIAFGAGYVPAESDLEVGGDWYDVIPLSAGRVAVVIGDVVGHGIRAAAIMGQLRSALRAYSLEGHSPVAVIERLNSMLAASGDAVMVGTLLLVVYDPTTSSLRYASAGHLPPLLVEDGGEPQYLEGGRSTPLGVRPRRRVEEATAVFPGGSTLLLFTDGLVERRGEPLEAGLERLRQLVGDPGNNDTQELCDRVLSELANDGPSADDMALVVLHSLAGVTDHLKLSLPAEAAAVTSARRAVTEWLREANAGEAEAFELSVAVGDACANAVEHAYGVKRGTFELEARTERCDVVIDVRDFGRWRSARGANRGRGLKLIEAFTDSVEIDRTDAGTRVRMRRRLGSREAA